MMMLGVSLMFMSSSVRLCIVMKHRIYKAKVAAKEAAEKIEIVEVPKPAEAKEKTPTIEIHDIGKSFVSMNQSNRETGL